MNASLLALLLASVVAAVVGEEVEPIDDEIGTHLIISGNQLLANTLNHASADSDITMGDYLSSFGSIWKYEDNMISFSFKNNYTSMYLCVNETGHMVPQDTKVSGCDLFVKRIFPASERGYSVVYAQAGARYVVLSPFPDTASIYCDESTCHTVIDQIKTDSSDFKDSSKYRFYLLSF